MHKSQRLWDTLGETGVTTAGQTSETLCTWYLRYLFDWATQVQSLRLTEGIV